MPNKPRVPSPNSPSEIEMWRIKLAVDISKAVTQLDILPEDGETIVTINADGSVTVSLDPEYTREIIRRAYFYGRVY